MKEPTFAEAFRIESESILRTGENMDAVAFTKAAALLARAPRIATSGCGHSGIACQHLAHLLCCIDRPARFLSPAEAVHGGLGFLFEGDVLVFSSRGGMTGELLPMAKIARAKGVSVITVTEKTDSALALLSDVVLPIVITKECDPYDCQGTTSFAVTSAVFDALQAEVIRLTGFKNEEFARIHPAGAVGARLNKGENL